MSIGERIKKVRKELGLTQQKFAERLGMKQNTVATYEMNRTNPSDPAIKSICREFNVSEKWLRTGDGEMFLPTPETVVDEVVKEYGLDDLDRQIIQEYIKLPEAERRAVKNYIKNLFGSVLSSQASILTPEQEARAEAERYYQELVKEKKQESQVLSAKESDVGSGDLKTKNLASLRQQESELKRSGVR